MKAVKVVIWSGFIVLFFTMRSYSSLLNEGTGCDIVALELAGPQKGRAIMTGWAGVRNGGWEQLRIAEESTYVDFLFLIFYSALFFPLSNSRMYREDSPWLENLLRMNLFLSVLAGLLDVVENILLLINLWNFRSGGLYYPTALFAWPKFILVAWVLLVLLISMVKGLFRRRKTGLGL